MRVLLMICTLLSLSVAVRSAYAGELAPNAYGKWRGKQSLVRDTCGGFPDTIRIRQNVKQGWYSAYSVVDKVWGVQTDGLTDTRRKFTSTKQVLGYPCHIYYAEKYSRIRSRKAKIQNIFLRICEDSRLSCEVHYSGVGRKR